MLHVIFGRGRLAGMGNRGVEAPASIRRRVRRLVEGCGVVEAARRLGLSREPVARVCAGMGVTRGTLALIEARIGEAEG